MLPCPLQTVFQPRFPQNRNKCSNRCFTFAYHLVLSYLCAFVPVHSHLVGWSLCVMPFPCIFASSRLCAASLWDCVEPFLFVLGGSNSPFLWRQWRNSRSSGSSPRFRRTFATRAALLVLPAVYSATKFALRRRSL